MVLTICIRIIPLRILMPSGGSLEVVDKSLRFAVVVGTKAHFDVSYEISV